MVDGTFTQLIVIFMIAPSAALTLSSQLVPLQTITTIGMYLRLMTMLNDTGATMVSFKERR